MTKYKNYCAICLTQKPDSEHWFLLIQSRWDDRIRVLRWNESLASVDGVCCACSPEHIQELVAHWMVTGSLQYPFAQTVDGSVKTLPRREGNPARQMTVDTSQAVQIGELAIHRDILQRVLLENPGSLASILEALVSGLDRGKVIPVVADEDIRFAPDEEIQLSTR